MKLTEVIAKTGANKKFASKLISINIMTAGSITVHATLTISDDKSHLLIGEGDHSTISGKWKISKIVDIYTMPHEVHATITHIVIEP